MVVLIVQYNYQHLLNVQLQNDSYLVFHSEALIYESKCKMPDHNQHLQTVPMELAFPMEEIHGGDVQWHQSSLSHIKILK